MYLTVNIFRNYHLLMEPIFLMNLQAKILCHHFQNILFIQTANELGTVLFDWKTVPKQRFQRKPSWPVHI